VATTVQAVPTDALVGLLARAGALAETETFADLGDIDQFKIGEAGFQGTGINREPKDPDSTKTDLESEGVPLTGTAEFTNGSPTVTGSGTTFLADVSVGQWIKPGSGSDDWGEVLTVVNDTTITLAANYIGASTGPGSPISVAEKPWLTFRKTLTGGESIFSSPDTTEITAIVTNVEATINQLGGQPEFFELGLFDSTNNRMVVYMTFPIETQTGLNLHHVLPVVW